FSPDGRFCRYAVRIHSRNEPPAADETVDEVVIHDLNEHRELRLRQEPGLQLLQHIVTPDGSRLLVTAGTRELRPDGINAAFPAFRSPTIDTVRTAWLYEFPSGRLIANLTLPPEKTVATFRYTNFGWRASSQRSDGSPEFNSFDWETETGKYL